MQVALKKYQQQLFSASDTILCKDSNRLSLPLEGTKITYKPLKGIYECLIIKTVSKIGLVFKHMPNNCQIHRISMTKHNVILFDVR